MRRPAVVLLLVLSGACGGSTPITPTPPTGPVIPIEPPVNSPPVIETVAIQGRRPGQPANFADLGEVISVSATVRDAETPVDQLQFTWTATSGTFSGSGATVTWQAPAVAPEAILGATPASVNLTLTVTEKYGHPGVPPSFEQQVSKTAPVSLHDSPAEVAQMSRQFLLDFSDTRIKDADYIMRNFGNASTCPDVREVQNEREDVIRNYTFFNIVNYRVDQPVVTVNFGGACPFRGKRGDACAVVPVFWDSIDTRINVRGTTTGNGIIAAAYSSKDSRWWLCASDYEERSRITWALR